MMVSKCSPTTPRQPWLSGFGLIRFRSPLLTESLNCFLFLRVLRCFSSPGLLPDLRRDNTSSTYWVAPFGHLRITSYLRIPAAFRSLSRPSSPLRAKASSVYSYLLSYLQYLALEFELLLIHFNLIVLPFQYVKEHYSAYGNTDELICCGITESVTE